MVQGTMKHVRIIGRSNNTVPAYPDLTTLLCSPANGTHDAAPPHTQHHATCRTGAGGAPARRHHRQRRRDAGHRTHPPAGVFGRRLLPARARAAAVRDQL
eukprot:351929-Chlamydomonas_euryale.AAC.11